MPVEDNFVWGAVLLIVAFAAYCIPTVVAMARDSRSAVGVCLVNLFLGWTLVGWLVAFVWAFSSESGKGRRFATKRHRELVRGTWRGR